MFLGACQAHGYMGCVDVPPMELTLTLCFEIAHPMESVRERQLISAAVLSCTAFSHLCGQTAFKTETFWQRKTAVFCNAVFLSVVKYSEEIRLIPKQVLWCGASAFFPTGMHSYLSFRMPHICLSSHEQRTERTIFILWHSYFASHSNTAVNLIRDKVKVG